MRRDIRPFERLRELGATEYLLDTLERQGGGHLVRVIDFEGPVDVQLLETAFRQLIARRPLLHVRIERSAGARPVFVRDDAVNPDFSVVARSGPGDWVREFDGQLNTPISLDDDAPVRVRVLSSDDAGGEIIVTAAHSVCDGRSLFAFCGDLLDEYEALESGEDARSAPVGTIPPPLEALFPEWMTGDRLKAAVDDFVARAAETADDPIVLFPLAHDAAAVRTSHVLSYSVPAAETSMIRRWAKEHGTSVTGAVAAAEMQALAELSRPPADRSIVLAVTIDLRPHLREVVPLASMGAYPGNVFTRQANVGSVDTWTLARDVTTEVAANLDAAAHLVMAVLGERFAEQFVTVDRPIASLSVANLGPMDLSHRDSVLRPRCIRGGAPLHTVVYPGVYSQVVTTSGVLWLTFIYVAPLLAPEIARDYGASVVERLISLARRQSRHR